ncbi:hypothetical protein Aperf_G00000059683 [Anoplocephala perfoliata]
MDLIELLRFARIFSCLFTLISICAIITTSEFTLLLNKNHRQWLAIGNQIFEFNALNEAGPKHILTWFQREHCLRYRLSSSCSGCITHSTEIEAGLYEICGLMQQKAFCGLYTATAQGMLSAVSEKRVADELVNRALEPSLIQHTGMKANISYIWKIISDA